MPPMPGRSDAGCIAAVGGFGFLVLAGGAVAYFAMTRADATPKQPDHGSVPAPPAPVSSPQPSPPPPAPRPAPAVRPAPPPPPAPPEPLHPARSATAAGVDRASGSHAPAADESLLRALAEAMARKVADPAYAEARRSGDRDDPDRLPFEAEVKEARARVAAAARAPAGVVPLPVPALPAGSVRVDGRLRGQEWNGALEIPLDGGSRLLVGHDGTRLLLAAEAPGDRTEKGFDQFRAYFHAGLAPSLVNERLHLAGNGWRSVLRETTVMWTGAKAAGEEDAWKEHPLTDWTVQERCEGESTMEGFRRYEAALDIEEAGIPRTAPFPLYVEIEGDPIMENGKFKRRVMVGGLGAQERPVWFELE